MNITATHFYEYCKCPRKVYNNFHLEAELKLPVSDFTQYLFERGKEHEKTVVSKMKFVMPTARTDSERFKQTAEFMENGKPLIYQGVLISGNLAGKPDLLVKKKGKSELGNYYYMPVDIKTGLSLKKEYAMQILFYAYLLEKIQGFMPLKAGLINGCSEKEEFKVQDYFNKFSGILFDIEKILSGFKVKPHICSECKECVWRDFCIDWALKKDDISLIYKLGRSKERSLINLGVDTVSKAASIDVDELSKVKGLGFDALTRFKNQAKSLKLGKVVRIDSYKFSSLKPIYFDIEADTELDVVYLLGLVSDGKYTSFFADRLEDEGKIWKEFLNYFKDEEDFKIYHYSSYEKTMLRKLFSKYGGNKKVYSKIISNMVDLLKVLVRTMVLPVYSYSIKDVAPYFGFKWSSEEASGGLAMIWYSKYLEGDLKLKKKILQYNEEDCRAMILVKDKIEK